MVTQQKLLDMIYEASTCYVPTNELSEEQLWMFDNITYKWCNCIMCDRPFVIGDIKVRPQSAAHANSRTSEIAFSRRSFKNCLSFPPPIFLLEMIKTSLHEIVHILYPEYNEEQTKEKTSEWLRRSHWVQSSDEFDKSAD